MYLAERITRAAVSGALIDDVLEPGRAQGLGCPQRSVA